MVRLLLILPTLITLAACTPDDAPVAAADRAAASATAGEQPQTVGGWRSDMAAYSGMGEPVAAFRTSMHGGGEIGSEELRGRWTILAFWGLWSEDSLADLPFMAAVTSAADQDPALDFLAVHTPPLSGNRENTLGGYLSLDQALQERGASWRTAVDDDGTMLSAFGLTDLPVYLLVAPDLTIVGVHRALSETPEDGVKPMFRGVAELRRRKAAED
jgi:hypothetical protein